MKIFLLTGASSVKSLTNGVFKSNAFYKIKGIEWDKLKEFDESKAKPTMFFCEIIKTCDTCWNIKRKFFLSDDLNLRMTNNLAWPYLETMENIHNLRS